MQTAVFMLSLLLAALMVTQARNPGSGALALVGGTIYTNPSDEPIRDGVVVINDGKVVAVGRRGAVQIPKGAQVLNCSGRTITAGFWNSHVHFTERKWINAGAIPAAELERQFKEFATRYGFTSVFDLSSIWENTQRLRSRIESGEVAGPRIRTTSLGLVPAGGLPPDIVTNTMGWMNTPVPEITSVEQVTAISRKLLDQGADGIKLFASAQGDTKLPEAAFAAAVKEAHQSGKPVFVHPNSGADVLNAVRGGVDVVAHTTPNSGAWDQTILTAMKERRVALIPTLWIWKWYARHDRVSAQDRIADTAVGQLKAWAASGGQVLFGNDLGAVDPDPTEEYVLMAQAGMNFRHILASLTTAPAERFGESKTLGRIATGLQADLVVLKVDPSKDIRALSNVLFTLRDGKLIYRE